MIEVAQIARSIAREVGGDEALAEAIALAHDLGHPPFGHAGERALRDALRAHGAEGWNANVHSLAVVDALEIFFIRLRGLNLTWAAREGIARHSTPFDEPVSTGEFSATRFGGLECQIVDMADVLAYLSHDLDDALAGAFIELADLDAAGDVVAGLAATAEQRWGDESAWPAEEHDTLVRRRIVAQLIARAITDVGATSSSLVSDMRLEQPDDVRNAAERVVTQSPAHAATTVKLLELLTERYYRSDPVRSSDARAAEVVRALFEELIEHPELMPSRFRESEPPVAAAVYVASLNDRSAIALAESWGLVQAPRA